MNNSFSIVVVLDASENMKSGKIARSFTALGLIDSITKITFSAPSKTCFRGSNQINRTWTSADLSILACSFCPFNFNAEDHRIVITDLEKENLLSSIYSTLYPTKMCRLMSSNP